MYLPTWSKDQHEHFAGGEVILGVRRLHDTIDLFMEEANI